MPIGNLPSRTPQHDSDAADTIEPWAVPLGRVAGTSLSLSYSVFIAAAILLGVVLVVARREGNTDLPRAALLGTSFWIAGWCVQMLTHIGITRCFGLRASLVNITLIGVEAMPRAWSALRTLVITCTTVTSLLVLGSIFRLAEGGLELPTVSPASSEPFIAPSIGFTDHDSIWRSAAWLCWVQALFQMYPLPGTQGRHMLASLAGLVGGRLSVVTQGTILRRCLAAIAFLTVVAGIAMMSSDKQFFAAQWPLLVLLGVLLWVSSRAPDVVDLLSGFHDSQEELLVGDDAGVTQHDQRKVGMVARIREWNRDRKHWKQCKRMLEQERNEAVDAQRLDHILKHLHLEGMDALDDEDRRILERVSKNLRKQRASESEQPRDEIE